MPMYSAEGGFTGSAKGSAISPSKSTSTRSSAPNAAAAAASSRLNSGNLGRSTSSGAGASLGSFSSAAAVNARTNQAASRNQTSNTAAKTSLPSIQRSNTAMKTSLPSGGNMASRGLARVGIGDTLSMRDNLSMRAPDGMADYRGLAAMTAGTRPTVNQIVSGYAPKNPNAGYLSTSGEIGSLAGPMPAFQSGRLVADGADYGAQMIANALARAPRQKDMARVPSKAEPTAVAGYQNPARSFPSRPNAPVTVASYQNPARSYPQRPQIQEADYATKTAIPDDAYASIRAPRAVPPSPVRLSDVPPIPASTFNKGVTLTPTDMIAGGYGAYQQAPAFGDSFPGQGTQTASLAPGRSPWDRMYGTGVRDVVRKTIQDKTNGAPQVAGAVPASSSDETSVQHPLYDGDTSPRQRIAAALQKGMELRAAPFRMAGDFINEKLGGSPYNDLYGRPGMNGNPNARDPLNTESSEKVKKLVAAAAAGDPNAKEELKKWFIWNQWGTGPRPANV